MIAKDTLYLEHMLECMDDIQTHIKAASALGVAHWSEHITTKEAIHHTLHTLAESGDRLSEALQSSIPEVTWHEVRGLRNILVHEYLGDIDNHIVDHVIHNDLPTMKTALVNALNKMDT